MSLRSRLCLIILVLFLLALGVWASWSVVLARTHITEEVQSAARLSPLLIDSLRAGNASGQPAFEERLAAIDGIRHLDVAIVSRSGESAAVDDLLGGGDIRAPRWFVSLVWPGQRELFQSVALPGNRAMIIRTDPADELEEVWREVRSVMSVMLALLAAIVGVLFMLIGYWLKPVGSIVNVLETIEKGDFSRRIPKVKLPELSMLAEKINHLTRGLGASQVENERLTRKSLHIQEQERRHLAHELHDSMGQSISAIKAMAVSIRQRSEDRDPAVAESAASIESASEGIYASVREMMGRLRPTLLDELGLSAALQQMADAWNDSHHDTFCRLRLEGNFDTLQEEQQINVYRIVQEALTNISKHARADSVAITLSGNEVVTLIISDNGIGYDSGAMESGMGLTGIRERVRVLHGVLNISARPRQGVSLQIEFPRVNKRKERRASDVRSRTDYSGR